MAHDPDGNIIALEAKEASNSAAAKSRARIAADKPEHVGALAFSRTGDPELGEFREGEVIAS